MTTSSPKKSSSADPPAGQSGTRWRLKRAYEPASGDDGFRVLVDRLWPRGISKADAHLDLHFSAVAPSAALRTWYGHEPAKFAEFARRYRAELDASGAVSDLLREVEGHDVVTLVVGAKDVEHSQGAVLMEYLGEPGSADRP